MLVVRFVIRILMRRMRFVLVLVRFAGLLVRMAGFVGCWRLMFARCLMGWGIRLRWCICLWCWWRISWLSWVNWVNRINCRINRWRRSVSGWRCVGLRRCVRSRGMLMFFWRFLYFHRLFGLERVACVRVTNILQQVVTVMTTVNNTEEDRLSLLALLLVAMTVAIYKSIKHGMFTWKNWCWLKL